jgi:hypothetical protein
MGMLLVVRYAAEGPGLVAWAVRMAAAREEELEVLVCDEEAGAEIAWADGGAGEGVPTYLAGHGVVRWGRVKLNHALSAIGAYLKEAKVGLVLTGKRNSDRKKGKNSPERRFARALIEHLPCAVCVLRLPKDNEDAHGAILVPVAGGAHSRVALGLASRMAGAETTAFYVEPDVDEVSQDVGERQFGGGSG